MSTSEKIDKNNVEDIIALTPTQEGMLFHYVTEPDSEMYFEQLSLRIKGEINVDLLKKAWEFIIKTNEMLRTIFRWKNVEKPMQIVLKEYEPDIREYDFAYMDIYRKEEMLSDLREELRKERIDISSKPYRIILCRMSKDELEMIICNHHIIYDGWSNMIILNELFRAYEQLYAGNSLSIPVKNKFKEYIRWIQRLDKTKQEIFWKDYLNDFSENTWLPYDEELKGNSSVKSHILKLSKDINEKLLSFTKKNRITPASVFYTVWGIVLQKLNFKNDCVFGTTVSGRTHEIKAIEEMVGLMINTLPLRVKCVDEETFMDVLNSVDKDLKSRQEYEASSITDIKSYINFERKQNLFNSIMVIENYPLDKSLNTEERLIKIQSYSMFEMTNYALTIGVTCGDDISINFIYDCSLFTEKTIVQLSEIYLQIFNEIMENAETKLVDVKLFNQEETEEIRGKYEKFINQKSTETEITVFTEPKNDIENLILDIWRNVLKIDKIGTQDNFFDIGGSSILLIQVHSKIEKFFPGVITGTDLFTYPTISKLAQYIKRKTNVEGENKSLEAISLPNDYFLQSKTNSDSSPIKFKLESDLVFRIRNVASQESSSEYIMLLSMFTYIFTEITESKSTIIHASTQNNNCSIPISINLNEIDGFSMLFKSVQNKLDKIEGVYSISELLQDGRRNHDYKVVPFFCNTKEIDGSIRLNEIYDIIFEFSEEQQEICFICQYNHQRLRKEKIIELVEGYCELIESLVEQYETI